MSLKDYDIRQLNLMQKKIDLFKQEPFCVDSMLELTEGLEDLLNVLEDVNEEFKARFQSLWWELEFTVSCMIDNQQQTPSDEDQQAVDKALIKMKTMIQDLINNKGKYNGDF